MGKFWEVIGKNCYAVVHMVPGANVFSRLVLLPALCLAALGCTRGRPEEGVTVTGKVTLNGKPLQVGMVLLSKEDDSASSMGEITTDGSYHVPNVLPGKVRAAVRTSPYSFMAKAAAQKRDGKSITIAAPKGEFVPVPSRYEAAATSGLTYEVEKGKPLDIELKSP